MRHGVKTKKLGREASHRKAMLNNLAWSILEKGLDENPLKRHVRTTLQKAKVVRSLVERLITYGKKGDLSARRQAAKFILPGRKSSIESGDLKKDVFKDLFGVLAERYKDRAGGYTRVLKITSNRHGDNAEMAIISLVEDEIKPKPKKKAKSKKKPDAKSQIVAEAEPVKAENAESLTESEKPETLPAEETESIKVAETEVSQAPEVENSSEEPKVTAKEDILKPDTKSEDKAEDSDKAK